jgi:cell division septum initiation protein DivIVA
VGEDPERLEREIERTRAKLGEDLDALEEKINPKKVAHRSVDRAKEKVAEVKDKVVGATGAAKEKVTAGGDGADGSSEGGIGDKVAGLAGTAKEKAGPLAATARDKAAPLAATAKEKVGPLAATAKDKAAVRAGLDPQSADTREVATAVAGGAWQTLREQTRRNPVAVGAAAFVLGVLIGR